MLHARRRLPSASLAFPRRVLIVRSIGSVVDTWITTFCYFAYYHSHRARQSSHLRSDIILAAACGRFFASWQCWFPKDLNGLTYLFHVASRACCLLRLRWLWRCYFRQRCISFLQGVGKCSVTLRVDTRTTRSDEKAFERVRLCVHCAFYTKLEFEAFP